MTQKKIMLLILLLSLSVIVILSVPFIGATKLNWSNLLDPAVVANDGKIFFNIRIPRTLVAFACGGMLALCGMVFQAMFRNPLVAPSTLGVSAGASFGAAVYIWAGLTFHFLGISGISLFAFAGAILSIYIVWSLSRIKYGSSTSKMLLAGIAVSFFFVSLIMFIQYMSDITQSFRITRWLMGGFFVYGYGSLKDIAPFVVIGVSVIWFYSQELNLLTTGEEMAISRGVDVASLMKILFFVISFIVGGIVSVCGPISFIGIMAPHICRLMIGFDHRYLTPATFFIGGLLLAICDTIARTVLAPGEIPVGIITAILGGPFFLWLLRTKYDE